MAPRSTRDKIRWQLEKAVHAVDVIQSHLKFADDLAGGSHPQLAESLPPLVLALEGLKDALVKLREIC